MVGAGVTCPATITSRTPARKAPVSNSRRAAFRPSCFVVSPGLESSPASCGPPPKIRNASIFGKVRQRYETDTVVRYRCALGYQQRLNPLVRCLSTGRWERPQVLCVPGELGVIQSPEIHVLLLLLQSSRSGHFKTDNRHESLGCAPSPCFRKKNHLIIYLIPTVEIKFMLQTFCQWRSRTSIILTFIILIPIAWVFLCYIATICYSILSITNGFYFF